MKPEEARAVLRAATWDDDGTFTLLRLGEDPGTARVHDLRLALRVLWRHWKDRDALPFDITQSAATILHFRIESERNLRDTPYELRQRLIDELNDIAQGAFELLSGPTADTFTMRRADLGE